MSEEGFLSRWSQRKRAVLRGEPPPEPEAEAPVVAALEPAAEAPVVPPEEPPFDPASLPPLESLTAESDFLPFLARNVPALLKRAALRKMWSLDIGIRDYVGPADYAWDYNAVGGVPGSSLDLFGDIGKHLAQAIGATPPPDPASAAPAPGTPAADPSPIVAEAPPADPLRLSGAIAEPASNDIAEAASNDIAEPAPNAIAEPAPNAIARPAPDAIAEAASVPPATAPEPGPRPRRHGAAMPG